ncbi:MAG TPA: hypothetical protein VFI42_19780 [Thermomicrobiaceae bacterium]|nr:hypothetical protein [Thermomicrobiaceae bacterium]
MEHEDSRRETIVDGLLAELLGRYGERFDKEQRAALREEVGKLYDAGQALRHFPLRNADEPELIFQPRAEG